MFFKRGFTLVEMLFVVIIAAGALALALPSYKGVRERSKFQAATGSLVALGGAVEAITRDLVMQGLAVTVGASTPREYTGASEEIPQQKTLKEWVNEVSGATREQRVLKALVSQKYLKSFNGGSGFTYYVLSNTAAASTDCKNTTTSPLNGTLVACMIKASPDSKDCFAGARYYKGGRVETIRMADCKN